MFITRAARSVLSANALKFVFGVCSNLSRSDTGIIFSFYGNNNVKMVNFFHVPWKLPCRAAFNPV